MIGIFLLAETVWIIALTFNFSISSALLIHQLQQENVNMNTEVLKVREENKDLTTVIQQLQESHNKNKIQWQSEIYELRQDNINKNNKNQKLERDVFTKTFFEENIAINNEMRKFRRDKAKLNKGMQKVQDENNDLRAELSNLN